MPRTKFPYSTACKHAIRAVTYLARHPEGDISINIASECGLPPASLLAILQSLTKHQILASAKGAHGGFSLRRDPVDICLGDIVRAIDGTGCSTECAMGYPKCPLGAHRRRCALHTEWQSLKGWIRVYLRETTIAELARQSARIECAE